jgi:signal transduction histidine kinase
MKRTLHITTTMAPDNKMTDIESSRDGVENCLMPHHDRSYCSNMMEVDVSDSEPREIQRAGDIQRLVQGHTFPLSKVPTIKNLEEDCMNNYQPRADGGGDRTTTLHEPKNNAIQGNNGFFEPKKNTSEKLDRTDVFQLFGHAYSAEENNGCYGSGSCSDASSVVSSRLAQYRRLHVHLCLVMIVGVTACTIILTVGLVSVRNSQETSFTHVAENVVAHYQEILDDYLTLGLWTHEACLSAKSSDNPRRNFRKFWEYVQAGDFEVRFVGCAINVSHDERAVYENETRAFLSESNLTSSIYLGFKEQKWSLGTQTVTFVPRSEQPFYIPNHFVEPVEDFSVLMTMDIDINTIPSITESLTNAFVSGQPQASGPIYRGLEFQSEANSPDNGFSLLHPGVFRPGTATRHVANVPISCNDLLVRVDESLEHSEPLNLILYDTTPNSSNIDGQPGPFFLCGATLKDANIHKDTGDQIGFIQEIPIEQSLQRERGKFQRVETLSFASREWTFVISTATRADYGGQTAYITLGAVLILVSTISLGLLIYTNANKIRSMNRMKASVEAEKTQIRLENARKAAQQERDLNDFIAHEVRNPLNAALAANTFVSASVNEAEPLLTEEKRVSVREDVQVIDNSLHFINDLLRNMLDMQRAASHQLNIEWTFVDLKRDILEPVASMLYRRGVSFEVIVDCPIDHLVVESDPLRLKQVVLNLGRNAAKFVETGFVRFRADVIDGNVHLFVEDSGSGVPTDKQDNLFGRFQESLDSLNQGTGIGLALCKNLIELLGGRIWLDKEYNSGIPGCPGACFVINLRSPSIEDDCEQIEEVVSTQESEVSRDKGWQLSGLTITAPSPPTSDLEHSVPLALVENRELPSRLSVLFVDDDFTLRKLFVRAVARVTDSWSIDQASNGETAVSKICNA